MTTGELEKQTRIGFWEGFSAWTWQWLSGNGDEPVDPVTSGELREEVEFLKVMYKEAQELYTGNSLLRPWRMTPLKFTWEQANAWTEFKYTLCCSSEWERDCCIKEKNRLTQGRGCSDAQLIEPRRGFGDERESRSPRGGVYTCLVLLSSYARSKSKSSLQTSLILIRL